jgi:hypothetical protein
VISLTAIGNFAALGVKVKISPTDRLERAKAAVGFRIAASGLGFAEHPREANVGATTLAPRVSAFASGEDKSRGRLRPGQHLAHPACTRHKPLLPERILFGTESSNQVTDHADDCYAPGDKLSQPGNI